MPLTLRIRSSQGMWRLTVPDATTTIQAVKAQIEKEKSITVATQKLTKDPQGTQELDDGSRLDAAGLGANGSIIYLSEKEVVEPPRAPTPPPPAPPPPNPLAAAGRNVLAGNDNGMSAEDQAAIAAALAEDDAPASPEVRRPDATQSPEALVGPPSSVGGLLEGLMNAPGGAAALAHAFQARQNAQRVARDDIYDSDDEDRDVARRLQDDYDEEEDDDDEGLARRLQDGDEEGDARLARRLAGQRGSSVNDGDAVLAAFLGGGGPPPLERGLSTGEDDPALQRALLQSTRPQQSAFAAGVDAQLERALAASRAEAGLEATERWDAPGPASPGAADDDDAALQAALLESAPPQQSEEERQIAEAIRLSALEAAPEEVLMTDAAATGARRLNRRRGSSDPDERMTSGSGSRKTD